MEKARKDKPTDHPPPRKRSAKSKPGTAKRGSGKRDKHPDSASALQKQADPRPADVGDQAPENTSGTGPDDTGSTKVVTRANPACVEETQGSDLIDDREVTAPPSDNATSSDLVHKPEVVPTKEVILIEAIEAAYSKGLRTTMKIACELGRHLLKAKKVVGPGNFMAWVERHLDGKITHRTATNYMQLAEANWNQVSNLTVKEALRSLAKPRAGKPAAKPKTARSSPAADTDPETPDSTDHKCSSPENTASMTEEVDDPVTTDQARNESAPDDSETETGQAQESEDGDDEEDDVFMIPINRLRPILDQLAPHMRKEVLGFLLAHYGLKLGDERR